MKTYRITLEYDGTRYSGWQEQVNARSVMGALRKAAEECFSSPVELHGAGRTDAGVHALEQVVHLRVHKRTRRDPAALRDCLNSRLPADIAVLHVEEAAPRFHARKDARSRCYVYQISTRKTAFAKKYVWWVKEELDLELMTRAAAMLEGRHDFACFRAPDPSKPEQSTVVVVERASISRDVDMILFRIEASHFLWRMVRRIAGALVKLGKHEIRLEDFEQLLAGRADARLDVAAWTAPASGLLLEKIRY